MSAWLQVLFLAAASLTGRAREQGGRRFIGDQLLITPIYDSSQTRGIELGLPAARFCPRVAKPGKALVVKVQRVGHDGGIFSPPHKGFKLAPQLTLTIHPSLLFPLRPSFFSADLLTFLAPVPFLCQG